MRRHVLRDLDEARTAWETLALASGNVFATWEWASLWLKHFGRDGRLVAVLWRTADGEPLVLLPLHITRRGPVRLARFVGHGPGDELGPICAPQNRSVAAAALRATLDEVDARWDIFVGERLPASPEWTRRAGTMAVRQEASPVLSLRGRSWEDILAGHSGNFRQQARRRERKLARAHELRFRLSNTPEAVVADLDTVIRLHDARWDAEGSGAFSGARRGFHFDWAATALARGWLRLWLLELDGDVVAGWYGFRFAERESYYQSGRDPQRRAGSVGFVLLVHTIREAAGDGMLEYRFLRGGEAYKDRFADGDATLDTVLAGRSGYGRFACRLAIRTQERFPEARRWLGRVVGAR